MGCGGGKQEEAAADAGGNFGSIPPGVGAWGLWGTSPAQGMKPRGGLGREEQNDKEVALAAEREGVT